MQGNQSSRNGFNWLQFIIDTWAVSVEVFLRRRFGWKYIGAQGAAVLLLIPLFTALWSEHDPGPLMCFFGAYLVMWAVAGAQAWWRRSRGEAVFSYYSGCPWLMSVFPRASEVTVKQWLEPILVGVVGAAIGERNVPL